VDDAGASEEVTTDEHFKIPCVTDALQEVTIECFQGGIAEVVFAVHILTTASRLLSLELESCSTLNQIEAAEAANPLYACPWASPLCQITISRVILAI
jgi:hypothetical protein